MVISIVSPLVSRIFWYYIGNEEKFSKEESGDTDVSVFFNKDYQAVLYSAVTKRDSKVGKEQILVSKITDDGWSVVKFYPYPDPSHNWSEGLIIKKVDSEWTEIATLTQKVT